MSSSFIKSEKVLIEGHFAPATIVIENGIISSLENLNFSATGEGSKAKIYDFGQKTITHMTTYRI